MVNETQMVIQSLYTLLKLDFIKTKLMQKTNSNAKKDTAW